ncbi:HAMP domain-containing sensor histidine kinase [Ascidiimonas aurantiaca]|uniref:sensor histidine kinase n=1 Tax=Ascidiimonas aurantiaca TaxID=1685432 RepID=UPI0030EEE133
MNKRKLYILVFSISVIGLAVVQYQYLKIGLNLAKVQFNQKVSKAGEDIRTSLYEENQLTFLVGKALTRDDSYFRLSMDSVQDASRFFLNDLLTEKLVQNGIETEFSYRLFARDTSFSLTSPVTFNEGEDLIRYPVILEGYLPKLTDKRLILELQFRDLNTFFLFQLNGLTIPGLVFMVAIIVVVLWVLRSFYWQRNIITTTNEFINNLTHELKTPVFSIGVAAKILEDDQPEEKKPVLEIIRQQVNRLKDHTDKVLELANLENKKGIFNLKRQDIGPVLRKTCEDFKLLTSIEKLSFSYNIPEEVLWVKADTAHLVNAINNLLDNARKYGGEIPDIHLEVSSNNTHVFIVIEDKGPGIEERFKNRIFDKYFRVVPGDLYKVKGHGLGLHYVKKVTDIHKGKVLVASKPGEGTAITVKLPRDKKQIYV